VGGAGGQRDPRVKLHATQKLLRYRGRIVCWSAKPGEPNIGLKRSRLEHLVRIGDNVDFPATICGLRCVLYRVVDKGFDCSTFESQQLCKACLFHFGSDLIIDDQTGHRWQGKTVAEWALEHERLMAEGKEVELRCRDLAIQLGASQAEAIELHIMIERLKQPPATAFKKAVLYMLGGKA